MNNVLELRQLWDIIRKHFFAILFMALIGAGLGFGIAKFLIAPTYSASTSMLVNRSNDNNNGSVNLSDQQADVQIIETYKNLVISSNVLGDAAKQLKHPEPIVVQEAKPAEYETLADGTRRLVTPAQKEITKPSSQKPYNLSVDQLKSMVSISNQQNSQVFSINVKAIKLLGPEIHEKIYYVIAGVGSGKDSLINQAKSFNYEKNLKLLGYRNDVHDINFASDASIFPSLQEGLGIAGLDATVDGTFLIGSNKRGIADYIRSGVNGIVFDGEAESLSKIIKNKKFTVLDTSFLRKFDKKSIDKKMTSIYQQF